MVNLLPQTSATRLLLQTYGYEHILTLNNLEKAGLLKAQTGGRNNYPTIRKTLRLWMDDVNEQVRCVPASHPASSLRQQTHLNLSICPTSYGPFHIILVCACV